MISIFKKSWQDEGLVNQKLMEDSKDAVIVGFLTLMKECWAKKPEKRPSANQLVERLNALSTISLLMY